MKWKKLALNDSNKGEKLEISYSVYKTFLKLHKNTSIFKLLPLIITNGNSSIFLPLLAQPPLANLKLFC